MGRCESGQLMPVGGYIISCTSIAIYVSPGFDEILEPGWGTATPYRRFLSTNPFVQ